MSVAQQDRSSRYQPSRYAVSKPARSVWLVTNQDLGDTFSCRKLNANGGLSVLSESGCEYVVDYHAATCSCPHHTHRQAYCKHLAAAEAIARFADEQKRREDERAAAIYRQKCEMARERIFRDVALAEELKQIIRSQRAA